MFTSYPFGFPARGHLLAQLLLLVPIAGSAQVDSATRADTLRRLGGFREELPSPTLTDALGSRFPGVAVLRSDGLVGTGGLIRIRGRRSLLLGNEPELEIDGVRVQARTVNFFTSTGDQWSGASLLDLVDPEDIERIEVDTDPVRSLRSGASIVNGLIRVTTRKGQRARPTWFASVETGVSRSAGKFEPSFFVSGFAPDRSCTLASRASGMCQPGATHITNFATDHDFGLLGGGNRTKGNLGVRGGGQRLRYAVSAHLERAVGNLRLPRAEQSALIGQSGDLPAPLLRSNTDRAASVRGNVDIDLSRNLSLELGASLTESRGRHPRPKGGFDAVGDLLTTPIPSPDLPSPWRLAQPAYVLSGVPDRAIGRRILSARLDWNIAPRLRLWSLGAMTADRFSDSAFAASSTPGVGTLDSTRFDSDQRAVEAGAEVALPLGSASLKLTGIAQYRRREFDSSALTLVVGSVGYSSVTGATSDQNFGGVLGADLAFGRFQVVGSVRRDQARYRDGRQDPTSSFGGAATWSGPISFRASAASVERVPDALSDSWFHPPGSIDPLRPERLRSMEVSSEVHFWAGRAGAHVALFRQDIDRGWALRPTLFGGVVYDSTEIRNEGIEAGLSADLLTGRRLVRVELVGSLLTSRDHGPPMSPRTACDEPNGIIFSVCGRRFSGPVIDINGDGAIGFAEVPAIEAFPAGSTVPTRTVGLGVELASAVGTGRLSLASRLDYAGGMWSTDGARFYQCAATLTCADMNVPGTPRVDQARAMLIESSPADYLRLREITLAYGTSGGFARMVGAKRLTLSITARNLLVVTEFEGWDPEVQTASSDLGYQTIFGLPLPLQRSVAVRLATTW